MRKLLGLNVLLGGFAVAMIATSIAACGGTDDTSTTGGGNESSFGEALATAVCDKLFECCNAADLVERTGNVPIVDYAGCHILYSAIWKAGIEPIVKESEAAERLMLDSAALDGCISALNGQSCADFAASVDLVACDNALVPKVDAGGACSNNLECTTGNCQIAAGANEGTCVQSPPLAGLNEPCMRSDDCEDGLYCNAAMCAAKKADGDTCTGDDECRSNVCAGDSQGPGQCSTVCEGGGLGKGPTDPVLDDISGPLVAAQCDKAVECCTPAELEEVIAQGISTKAECYAINSSFYGLALLQIHNYAAEGKVAVDGAALKACVDDYSAITCQDFSKSPGLECPDGIKGLVADGDACTDNAVCASTNCFKTMPNQGTCEPLPASGDPCSGKCAAGLYCDAGMCAAQKAAGQMCLADGECAEGFCVGPMPTSRTCSVICDGM